MIEIGVKLLSASANNNGHGLPFKATPGAAGYDLYAMKAMLIPHGQGRQVPTGIALEIPPGYEGQVRSRSGLVHRHNVFVMNSPGTIDSDYRGEVMCLLFNAGQSVFEVREGDRIAQLVFAPVLETRLVVRAELTETTRGQGGFGSTGR